MAKKTKAEKEQIKNARNEAKKAKKKAKQTGSKTAKNLLLFTPYLLICKAILKKKGVKEDIVKSMSPVQVLETFYRVVIKKQDVGQVVQEVYGSGFQGDEFGLADDIVGAIIKEVVQFIKTAVDKRKAKKAGTPVATTPEEDEVGDEVEQDPTLKERIEAAIAEYEDLKTKEAVGEFVIDNNIVIAGIAAVLLYLATRK